MTELTELEREFEQSWVEQELMFAYLIIQYKTVQYAEIYKLINRTGLPAYTRYRKNLRAHMGGISLVLSRSAQPDRFKLQLHDKPHLHIAADKENGYRMQLNNMHSVLAYFPELIEGEAGINPDVLRYFDELLTYPID